MKKYFVNKNPQSNGDHEVHHQECVYLPLLGNRQDLGYFSSCIGAVAEAKKIYNKANGCKTCSNLCHTS